MAASYIQGGPIACRRATSVLTPALLISIAVHAAIGGILFQHWRRAAVEPAPMLTVKLEVVPPAVVETPAPLPPPRIKQPTPVPKARAAAPLVPHVPVPTLIAVERVDSAPTNVAPRVAEAPPAPLVVATAPAATVAAPRVESIEPPHFEVAYLNNPRPAYPPTARKLGLDGLVLLRVEVSAKGTPEKIAIAQTSGASLLDDAAMKAVQGWTFVPARRGDTPIAHPVEVPIRFRLKN
jgi:periplasmic protein TonB